MKVLAYFAAAIIALAVVTSICVIAAAFIISSGHISDDME